MRKFKIQGKTYRFIEELPNVDESIIRYMYKIMDSKKQEYTLIKSVKCYTLYKDNKVFTKTYSIQEIAG